jgi:hypothetical protein
MSQNELLQSLAADLFEKAKTISDKRWRRYVLDEANRLCGLMDPLESELRLQNLITVTETVLQTKEGAIWLDQFLAGLPKGDL